MAKTSRRQRRLTNPGLRGSKKLKPIDDLLERGTLEDLRKAKYRTGLLRRFHWDFYSELARQREEIKTQIHAALNEAAVSNFEFQHWQRAVKYKYGLHPLSAVGSLGMPGGRFNIGDVNSNVPSFPALYIAIDKDTALQETLGQSKSQDTRLSPQEVALTNPESETIVSVTGSLGRVFDLRSANNLRKFVNLIKGFTISAQLRNQGVRFGAKTDLVLKPSQLMKSLMVDDWCLHPMVYDVPANSQIFGQMVSGAGIEGIIYPSKLTKKPCLAIFPRNFENSSSFIKLDHETPDSRVRTRIDAKNWRLCEMSTEDVFALTGLH